MLEEFLNELSKLSEKYNIGIGGCGCCGSPFLYNLEDDIVFDNIEQHPSDGKLEWDKNLKRYKY